MFLQNDRYPEMMRSIIYLCLLFSFKVEAQTVMVTNLVTAAPSFREVDGKLYNNQKSVLWEQKKSKVVQVEADHLIVDTYQEQVLYETTQRQV